MSVGKSIFVFFLPVRCQIHREKGGKEEELREKKKKTHIKVNRRIERGKNCRQNGKKNCEKKEKKKFRFGFAVFETYLLRSTMYD